MTENHALSTRSHSLLRILTLVVLMTMLLSCGTPGTPGAQTTETTSAPAEAVVEPTAVAMPTTVELEETSVAPASATDVATAVTTAPASSGGSREETLIMAFEGGAVAAPDIQNPYVQGAPIQTGLHQAVMESLFYLNYETGELMPWLAESSETSTDGMEVTIKLRDGVKWSDGQPFTADDVVFTINMLKENAPELQFSTDMQKWVKDVQAADPRTVRITLTEPSQRFVVNNFGVRIHSAIRIVPKHIWEGQDPKTFRNYDLAKGWPVFTGPYKLVQASTNEFVYERRDDWWAAATGFHPLPAPKRLIFVEQGPEERRAAQLEANDIDAAPSLGIGAFEAVQAKNPNVVAWTDEKPFGWLDPCPHYLEINTKAAPWDDPEMRQALAAAIDTAAYSNVVGEGAGVAARFLFPAYPALDAYLDRHKDILEKYNVGRANPDMAMEIFERKGYTKGSDGIYVSADGQRLENTLIMLSAEAGGTTMPVSTQALTEFMESVGIAVEAKMLDWSAWSDTVETGQFDTRLQWSCGSVTDPYETLDNWHNRHIEPIGERASGNLGRWDNAEFSKLVDQIAKLPPGDEKIDPLFAQALEIWYREAPGVPLQQQPRVVPYNTTYWTNWPSASTNYVQPANWWMTAMHIITNVKPAE